MNCQYCRRPLPESNNPFCPFCGAARSENSPAPNTATPNVGQAFNPGPTPQPGFIQQPEKKRMPAWAIALIAAGIIFILGICCCLAILVSSEEFWEGFEEGFNAGLQSEETTIVDSAPSTASNDDNDDVTPATDERFPGDGELTEDGLILGDRITMHIALEVLRERGFDQAGQMIARVDHPSIIAWWGDVWDSEDAKGEPEHADHYPAIYFAGYLNPIDGYYQRYFAVAIIGGAFSAWVSNAEGEFEWFSEDDFFLSYCKERNAFTHTEIDDEMDHVYRGRITFENLSNIPIADSDARFSRGDSPAFEAMTGTEVDVWSNNH